jgi:hypothetical protein
VLSSVDLLCDCWGDFTQSQLEGCAIRTKASEAAAHAHL